MFPKWTHQGRVHDGQVLDALRMPNPGDWPRVLMLCLLAYLLAFAGWQMLVSSRVVWAVTINSMTRFLPDLALIILLLAVVCSTCIDGATHRA